MPYRRSKLTLLMKDVFDISCRRMCSTVVLAHVSPIVRDIKHSTSTLKYVSFHLSFSFEKQRVFRLQPSPQQIPSQVVYLLLVWDLLY